MKRSILLYYCCALLLVMAFSCKPYRNRSVSKIDIVNGDTFKVVRTYYSNRNPNELLRYKNGKLHGTSNFYSYNGGLSYTQYFYEGLEQGVVKRYYSGTDKIKDVTYLTSDSTSIFSRYLDSAGRITKELGSPYVGYDIKDGNNRDTFKIELYFCDFGCDNMRVEVSPNGEDYREVKVLNTDRELTKMVYLRKEVRQLDHFGFYLRTQCGLNSPKVYYDTVSFNKKPNDISISKDTGIGNPTKR